MWGFKTYCYDSMSRPSAIISDAEMQVWTGTVSSQVKCAMSSSARARQMPCWVIAIADVSAIYYYVKGHSLLVVGKKGLVLELSASHHSLASVHSKMDSAGSDSVNLR